MNVDKLKKMGACPECGATMEATLRCPWCVGKGPHWRTVEVDGMPSPYEGSETTDDILINREGEIGKGWWDFAAGRWCCDNDMIDYSPSNRTDRWIPLSELRGLPGGAT